MADTNTFKKLFVRSSKALRMFLFMSTLFIMLGIWLTGFEQVHWFLYIVPIFYSIAFIFGICPGINLWRMVFKES